MTSKEALDHPQVTVERMRRLLAKARDEAKADSLATARLDYVAPAVADFFAEITVMAGRGFRPLDAYKVGENPTIDRRPSEES